MEKHEKEEQLAFLQSELVKARQRLDAAKDTLKRYLESEKDVFDSAKQLRGVVTTAKKDLERIVLELSSLVEVEEA